MLEVRKSIGSDSLNLEQKRLKMLQKGFGATPKCIVTKNIITLRKENIYGKQT